MNFHIRSIFLEYIYVVYITRSVQYVPGFNFIMHLVQSHKSPGIDQIPAELIKEGGRTIRYQIYKLVVSI